MKNNIPSTQQELPLFFTDHEPVPRRDHKQAYYLDKNRYDDFGRVKPKPERKKPSFLCWVKSGQ